MNNLKDETLAKAGKKNKPKVVGVKRTRSQRSVAAPEKISDLPDEIKENILEKSVSESAIKLAKEKNNPILEEITSSHDKLMSDGAKAVGDLKIDTNELFLGDSIDNGFMLTILRYDYGLYSKIVNNPKRFLTRRIAKIIEVINCKTLDNATKHELIHNYSTKKLTIILEALDKGYNIIDLIDHKYDYKQIKQILLGLVAGIDVKPYLSTRLTYRQMRELRKAIIAGHDLSIYGPTRIPSIYLKEFRKFVNAGYGDIVKSVIEMKCSNYMKVELIKMKIDGIEISEEIDNISKCNLAQMRIIFKAIRAGLDYKTLLKHDLHYNAMEIEYQLMLNGSDMSQFDDDFFKRLDCSHKLHWLAAGFDLAEYPADSENYNLQQIRAIIKCKKLGLDSSVIMNPHYRMTTMYDITSVLIRKAMHEELAAINHNDKASF